MAICNDDILPELYYVMADPSITQKKYAFHVWLLMHNGSHENYVMSQSQFPPEFFCAFSVLMGGGGYAWVVETDRMSVSVRAKAEHPGRNTLHSKWPT